MSCSFELGQLLRCPALSIRTTSSRDGRDGYSLRISVNSKYDPPVTEPLAMVSL